MDANDLKRAARRFFSRLARSGAVAIAIVYASGFAVVSLHLGQYGVAPFGIVRLQYLLAGLWLLAPLVMFLAAFLWLGAYIYDEYWAEERARIAGRWPQKALTHVGRILRAIFWWVSTAMCILVIMFSGFPAGYGGLSQIDVPFTFRYVGALTLYAAGLAVTLAVAVGFFSEVDIKDLKASAMWTLRAAVLLSVSGAIAMGYIAHFTFTLFPRLPASVGGGEPVHVRFTLRPDAASHSLSTALFSATATYRLLTETETAYVVLDANNPPQAAISLSKTEVSAAFFVPRSAAVKKQAP